MLFWSSHTSQPPDNILSCSTLSAVKVCITFQMHLRLNLVSLNYPAPKQLNCQTTVVTKLQGATQSMLNWFAQMEDKTIQGKINCRKNPIEKVFFCWEAVSYWSSAFTRLIIISLCIQLRFTVATAQNSNALYTAGIVIWGYLHWSGFLKNG